MIDHSEIKRLADACPPPGTYHYQSKEWAALMEFQAAVEDVYGSDVGMAKALIAEVESLREHKQSLVDLREANGYESWASALVMIDKLKIEVEGLRAQHGRDSAELRNLCQARDDARKERNGLKAEIESLRIALQEIQENSTDISACECAADALADSSSRKGGRL